MTKEDKYSTSFDEVALRILNSEESIREFLNVSLEDYLEDLDFGAFYRSLEICIKAKDTLRGFSKKINLSTMSLYNIVNGKKEPKISTLAKILKELGLSLRVA